jgi:hypothetical protein
VDVPGPDDELLPAAEEGVNGVALVVVGVPVLVAEHAPTAAHRAAMHAMRENFTAV